MKKAFLTGATGFLGSHLAERLVDEGFEVSCLVRKTSNLRWIEKLPLNLVYGDISDDLSWLASSLSEMDYVFHVAGLVHTDSIKRYYEVNGDAAGNLAKICAENCKNLKRFVLVSSLAAVGKGDGGNPANDLIEPKPLSEYGKSKREGEVQVLQYSDKIPISIIRPPAIFGPRDSDILLFFRLIENRIRPVLAGGRQKIPLLYVTNVVDGIMLAAEKDGAIGRAFLLGDGENAEINILFSYIEQFFGRKALPVPVPAIVLIAAGVSADIIAKAIGKSLVISYDKVKELLNENWAVDDSCAREVLGYYPAVSIQEGIEKTYEWYKENKWL
ncbi:MAG: NAD(P)-dependent oxidoreductase [Myxococcota bacterium]